MSRSHLARLLKPEDSIEALSGKEIHLHTGQGYHRAEWTLRVQQSKDAGLLGAYHPVIPLELSPTRFRVLVPLEAASTCLDRAIDAWNDQFGRVWDRLPLRAGVVAFPQKLPFQAVIEATRNVEEKLLYDKSETQRVTACDARSGIVALVLKRPGIERGAELHTVPVSLPDGRTDVFYPYLAVEDNRIRFPRDFQHPEGRVYRHVLDLRPGDGVRVYPARVSTMFMDSTGQRFEPCDVRPLAEWTRMRDVWRLVERKGPSLSALHRAWTELVERWRSWQDADGRWLPGGRDAWKDLVRAVFADRLAVRDAALDAIVEAADDGTLAWAFDWLLAALKERIGEGVTHG